MMEINWLRVLVLGRDPEMLKAKIWKESAGRKILTFWLVRLSVFIGYFVQILNTAHTSRFILGQWNFDLNKSYI